MTAAVAVALFRTMPKGQHKEIPALYTPGYQLSRTLNTLRVNTPTALAHKSNRFAWGAAAQVVSKG